MKRTALENWIMETEKLPELDRELLEKLQLERLNNTLQRIRESRDFYKDYPQHLERLDELKTLPFTDAAMLAAKPGNFLVTSQAEVSKVISGATSGTTGPAKRVFYTEKDTEHTVGFFAAGISEMLKPGEKCFIAFPFTGPFALGELIAKAVERLGAIPVKAGFGQSWGELCALIREAQPETYIGFPATLLGLCRMYRENFPVKRALVSGDACPDGVMAALEKKLGTKLYPHYGSRECGLGGAVTCQAFEGMHLRENHIIAEIIDADGNVLPDGEYGELVITTIGLEAMPLVRYRTGDFTRILPPCPCGGVTKRLDTVSRRDDIFSIEKLDSVVFAFDEVVDYKATVKDKMLELELSCTEKPDEAVLREHINRIYPDLNVSFSSDFAEYSQKPMYLGKRCVL